MGEDTKRRFSNEFWLTILIFSVTVAFSAGASLMAFETKAEAERKQVSLKEYADKTYMPRELSLEKWSTNESSHAKIEKSLDDILRELRRKTK
jgi:hypothetical protein